MSSLYTSSKLHPHTKCRPWSLGVFSKQRLSWGGRSKPQEDERYCRSDGGADSDVGGVPYVDQRIRAQSDQSPRSDASPHVEGYHEWDRSREDVYDLYSEELLEPDAYSWVDPSELGAERFRSTPSLQIAASSMLSLPVPLDSRPLPGTPPSPQRLSLEDTRDGNHAKGIITPDDSYSRLLAYQSTSDSSHSSRPAVPGSPTGPSVHQQKSHLPSPSDSGHIFNPDPEWHELVDRSFCQSLPKNEQKRQGLWWELIKGEREYVRDLGILCNVFIQGLRECRPSPIESYKLNPFIAEVFSTTVQIYCAHANGLELLMERQRNEWPLLSTATDILLRTSLEVPDLYDAYMKNYPFAEARVRRESAKNPAFRHFLSSRTTASLTHRRDFFVFLSRPLTRLPRMLLILNALLKVTPPEHADSQDIIALKEILERVLRSTQPGIESAESKIKLWNIAEGLLFKKGEIMDLDITDPKRALVHMGYVFRRVRNETNWHGWQDIKAILLDNYFLLTRHDEGGRHVVISRPIPLDFLSIISADGVPERRYDHSGLGQQRAIGGMLESLLPTEMLMFPFTISAGGFIGRTYTLCTGNQSERQEWIEKIVGAKTLRKFDMESNRAFVINTITTPLSIKDPITSADTFTIHDRETVAVSTHKSVWIGWLRDIHSFREVIRFDWGHITSVTVIQDFSWLLVISSGTLYAFSLNDILPTPELSTWVTKERKQGQALSKQGCNVAWVSAGRTKGRILVAYATHSKASHVTVLNFLEPMFSSNYPSTSSPIPNPLFRSFSTLTLPGYASSLTFFRQTIAVVSEKTIVIAEPGNSVYNSVPTPGSANSLSEDAPLLRLLAGAGKRKNGAKPLGMWQTGDNEFMLVYDWGACFVTKYGEISRSGSFLRWNLTPSHAVFKAPHLLLFDECGGRAEIREVSSGKMCEVVEEKGLKMIPITREEQGMVGWSERGLVQLVETVAI